MADDPGVLLLDSGKITGGIHQKEKGDVEGIAKANEPGALVRRIHGERAAQEHGLVGNDPDGHSSHPGETGEDILGEVSFGLHEIALIHDFLDAAATMPRRSLLEHFARVPGCHVPGLTRHPLAIARADDRLLPARSQIVTRNTVLSSMFLIEPERGCSRGCTYCVMRRTTNGGMRLVPPDAVLSFIPDHARRVGLVGAAVTDHPEIKDVVQRIVESGREVGISSLRADRLDEELVGLLARGGTRTLTTAADGASQRLRDLLDRRTNEKHLLRAASLARRFGLQRMKLYQLIGLPQETCEDLEELVRFCRELSRIVSLSLAISPFVAKRNTPLDGARFEPIPSLESKIARLRAGLQGRADLRSTSARWAWVEFMLSQGNEQAGLAAMDAWLAGGKFAAGERAFQEREVEPAAARSPMAAGRTPGMIQGDPPHEAPRAERT